MRLSTELKRLLARAAAYSSVTLSGFIVASAAQRAKQIVAEHETLSLTPRDWGKFLAALDKAGRRRPRLERAAKRYLNQRAR